MALWADLRQQWALGTDSEVEAVDPGRTSPVGGPVVSKGLDRAGVLESGKPGSAFGHKGTKAHGEGK